MIHVPHRNEFLVGGGWSWAGRSTFTFPAALLVLASLFPEVVYIFLASTHVPHLIPLNFASRLKKKKTSLPDASVSAGPEISHAEEKQMTIPFHRASQLHNSN